MSAIYLNAASHGLPSAATLARMKDHLALECEIGPLAATEAAEAEVAQVHDAAAQMLGVAREDVALTSTTTATLAGVLPGIVKAGDRVLVAPEEWGDNIRLLHALGAVVTPLPALEPGDAQAAAWAEAFTGDEVAICAPLVSSVTGRRLPLEALGHAARPEGCIFIVDLAQAMGQVEIDLAALGADIACGTGRKWLRGPRTTAVAWRAPRIEARLPIAQLRPNDGNVALQLGLGVAIAERRAPDYGLRDRIWEAAQGMGLASWDEAAPQTGGVTLAVPLTAKSALKSALEAAGITVKFPDSAVDEPYLPSGPDGCAPMRVTPHRYNTEEEAVRFLDAVNRTLTRPSA